MGTLAAEPPAAEIANMGAVLYRYLLIVVACISLLIGLQVPNFVDQYRKRVDAHLREVSINLQPFQEIANKYFNGDMGKLIELHRNSEVKPFQEEGLAIEKMVARKLRFEADLAALQTSLPLQVLNILLHGDREILDEVMGQYSYSVPLNQDALVFGAAVALAVLLLLELLLALARAISRKFSRSDSLPHAL
jgi:competence protein ComGC